MVGIIRPQTALEKRDFQDIGTGKEETIRKKFKELIVEEESKNTRQHKPFCYRCAKIDFEQKLIRAKEEQLLKQGYIDMGEIDFELPDLEQYKDLNRFNLIKKTPIRGNKVVDGIKVPYLVGHYFEYKCKTRGCGNSVEVPIRDDALKEELEFEKIKTKEN